MTVTGRHITRHYVRNKLFCLPLLGLLLATNTAKAEITSVKVTYRAPFGQFGDNTYHYVEATVTGTLEGSDGKDSTYSAPAIIIYPESGGNGYGWVNYPNTTFFDIYPRTGSCNEELCPTNSFCSPCETRGDFCCHEPDSVPLSDNKYQNEILMSARLFAGDEFLFSQGYTYLAIQVNKTVTDQFGPTPPDGERTRLSYGTIERAEDEFGIYLDSARLLRDLSTFDNNGFEGPVPMEVNKIIASGFSQTAVTLRTIVLRSLHLESDGSPIYDGMFAIGSAAICRDSIEDNPPTYYTVFPCGPEVMNTLGPTKLISVGDESNLEAVGAMLLRRDLSIDPDDPDCAKGPGPDCDPNPNYYHYELAGVAHIPSPVHDTAWMGSLGQSPADPRPFVRARIHDLYEWLENDTAPVEPINIEGSMDPESGLFVFVTDEDGNSLGGIRLPHMSRTLPNGDPAGAPLGVYKGLDYSFLVNPGGFPPGNLMPLLAGTFTPFSQEELTERYGDAANYVALVTAAAKELYDDGYILEADYDAYVEDAERENPVPRDVTDPDFSKPPAKTEGCGVSGSGGGELPTVGFLYFLLLFVLRRREGSRSSR